MYECPTKPRCRMYQKKRNRNGRKQSGDCFHRGEGGLKEQGFCTKHSILLSCSPFMMHQNLPSRYKGCRQRYQRPCSQRTKIDLRPNGNSSVSPEPHGGRTAVAFGRLRCCQRECSMKSLPRKTAKSRRNAASGRKMPIRSQQDVLDK